MVWLQSASSGHGGELKNDAQGINQAPNKRPIPICLEEKHESDQKPETEWKKRPQYPHKWQDHDGEQHIEYKHRRDYPPTCLLGLDLGLLEVVKGLGLVGGFDAFA